jgi:putative transcriptional regulator
MKNNIKVERARKNLTQAELAEILKVSRQTINAIELGKFNPSVLLALRMAKVFEVTVNQLFELQDED